MSELIEITDNPDVAANDYVVAKNIAETLHKHYPGHLWAVTSEGKKGIATIRNLLLTGSRPYVLHLKTIFGDPHLRCVVRAGGHILEAYKQRRGRADFDSIASLPHALDGFPMPDPDSLKPKARKSLVREIGRNAWTKIKSLWNR